LEPEILLVDEVLAVGDLAFQKKCLGKMNEVTRTGRTILFVSHNTATILNLCQQVAVFERGRLSYFGDCAQGVEAYARSAHTQDGAIVELTQHPNRRGGSPHILQQIRMLDACGVPNDQFRCGEPIRIELTVDPCGLLSDLHFGIEFEDSLGTRLFTVATHLSQSELPPIDGQKRIVCALDELPLAPGRYAVSLLAGPLHQQRTDAIDQAAWFDVIETDFYGNGRLPQPNRGRLLMRSRWEMLTENRDANGTRPRHD
jgi:lipopolysaccharide transport system ATP-binding protein